MYLCIANSIATRLTCMRLLQAAAAAAVLQGWHIVGSVLYTLSLNHKQMLMYFAPAFFSYLLGRCLRVAPQWSTSQGTLWHPQEKSHPSKPKKHGLLLLLCHSIRKLFVAQQGDGKRHSEARTTSQQRAGALGDHNQDSRGAMGAAGGGVDAVATLGGAGGPGNVTAAANAADVPSDTPSVPSTVRDQEVASSECSHAAGRWRGWAGSIAAVASLGAAVILAFAAVWSPFLFPDPAAATPVRPHPPPTSIHCPSCPSHRIFVPQMSNSLFSKF